MNPLSAIQAYHHAAHRSDLALAGTRERAGVAHLRAEDLRDLPPLVNTAGASQPAPGQEASFGTLLGSMVREVSDKQQEGMDAVRGLLGGQGVSLHQAMIALEEASVSFQLMVEVRNKLLESYQELMRMQV